VLERGSKSHIGKNELEADLLPNTVVGGAPLCLCGMLRTPDESKPDQESCTRCVSPVLESGARCATNNIESIGALHNICPDDCQVLEYELACYFAALVFYVIARRAYLAVPRRNLLHMDQCNGMVMIEILRIHLDKRKLDLRMLILGKAATCRATFSATLFLLILLL
jgi:hypothetical protein